MFSSSSGCRVWEYTYFWPCSACSYEYTHNY